MYLGISCIVLNFKQGAQNFRDYALLGVCHLESCKIALKLPDLSGYVTDGLIYRLIGRLI